MVKWDWETINDDLDPEDTYDSIAEVARVL